MRQPKLNEISMDGIFNRPNVIITMSRNQWDGLLQAAYDAGHILLEVDKNEQPVKAYRRKVKSDV